MSDMLLTQVYAEARRNTGWMKFVGVLLIVTGIPGAIVLVGLINIWMGVVIFQAASAVDQYGEEGLVTFVQKIGTYFRIYAVLTIIGLLFAMLVMGLALFGVFQGLSDSGIFT